MLITYLYGFQNAHNIEVYIGNLPEDATEEDLSDAASAYGRVLKVSSQH